MSLNRKAMLNLSENSTTRKHSPNEKSPLTVRFQMKNKLLNFSQSKQAIAQVLAQIQDSQTKQEEIKNVVNLQRENQLLLKRIKELEQKCIELEKLNQQLSGCISLCRCNRINSTHEVLGINKFQLLKKHSYNVELQKDFYKEFQREKIYSPLKPQKLFTEQCYQQTLTINKFIEQYYHVINENKYLKERISIKQLKKSNNKINQQITQPFIPSIIETLNLCKDSIQI